MLLIGGGELVHAGIGIQHIVVIVVGFGIQCGLEAGKTYTVTEYASDDLKTYTIEGSNPYITPSFERDYLIEVKPAE